MSPCAGLTPTRELSSRRAVIFTCLQPCLLSLTGISPSSDPHNVPTVPASSKAFSRLFPCVSPTPTSTQSKSHICLLLDSNRPSPSLFTRSHPGTAHKLPRGRSLQDQSRGLSADFRMRGEPFELTLIHQLNLYTTSQINHPVSRFLQIKGLLGGEVAREPVALVLAQAGSV